MRFRNANEYKWEILEALILHIQEIYGEGALTRANETTVNAKVLIKRFCLDECSVN